MSGSETCGSGNLLQDPNAGILREDVTARKQAENALHASEERLNLALSAGRLATWDLHLPTSEVVWNDEQFRILGYEIGEVVPSYEAWAERLHPEDRERTEAIFAQAMKDCAVYHAEFRSLWPDGTVRWMEGRGMFHCDARGQATRAFGIMMDITERKQAEVALARAHSKLERVLGSIAEGFLVLDKDWRFTYFNEQGARMLGMRVEQLIGARVWELFPHAKDAKFFEFYHRAVQTGRPVQFEEYYPHPLNMWLECHCYPSEGGVSVYYQDVTERKRTEDALRQSEERFRLLVEQAVDGIFLSDSAGHYIDVNSAGHKMLGYTRDEILSSTFVDLLAPEEVNRLPLAIAKLAEGQVTRSEWRFRRKDGSEIVGEVVGRQTPDGNLLGILRDITDRKQIDEKLREREAFLARMTDVMPNILSVFDITTTSPVYINRNVASVLGFSAEEVMAMGNEVLPRLMHPDDLPRFEQHRSRVLALCDDDVAVFEFRMRARGGDWRWFQSRDAVFARDGLGRVRRLIGTATDITERKEAEQALRKSEERFSAIVASAMDAIIALDAEHKIILFNKAAEIMFGLKADEVLGASIERLIPKRFHAAHREHIKRFGADGATTRAMGQLGAVWGLRANGEEFPIEASISQLALDDRRIFTVILRDITERKRAEAALKDADRRKDEFLATLAHELRNPLAPIRNGLHVLRKAGSQEETAERVRSMMERQVDHLVRLVDDLLEISRITRGKIELRKERADLATVVADAVEMNRALIDTSRLDLRVALPDERLLLDGDPIRLTQIFANLLNNAAKYTDPGGRIEIAGERAVGHAVVSVVDTGVGIPKEMLPHVFNLFAQAGDLQDRSKGGLGIGLALVRNLAELHGGNVEAHSEGEGRGARFVVRLPLSPGTDTAAPPSRTEASQARASRRVLIVDDMPDVADSLALLLESLGANVRVANSGAEGLAACAEFAPDMVFLDIGMPGMDGFETARRMRELPAGRKATLVALTGWGEEATRKRVKDAGFDRHITKPADIGELEALLETTP